MTPIDPLALAALVAAILEKLRVPYVIGGSVASSVVGEPRSTLDLDIMIDADVEQVRRLAAALRDSFYVDEDDAVQAVRSAAAFNVIHLDSSMKVDFFIAEPLGRKQIARRRVVEVRPGLSLFFYSPEDLAIRKLLWFRMGGEVSSRQWNDVVSILKTTGTRLDREYLQRSAAEEEVADLLLRAIAAAGS